MRHSFVESPEQRNLYFGRAKTINKEIEIELPAYFEALNKDHRFVLTPINSLCRLGIKQEVVNNKFIVMSDEDCEFDYMVSGIRQDRFALANPVIVEGNKEKPSYIHPYLWN